MLLSQFQKLQEIDHKLNELHNERVKLFNAGTTLQPSYISQAAMTQSAADFDQHTWWVQQTYAELVVKWQAHGISIPKFNSLQSKLEQARQTLAQISIIKPELHDKLSVVLVPPHKETAYSSASSKSKKLALLHLSQEFIDAKFAQQTTKKSWRLIIALSQPEGIYVGTPKQLLGEKPYVIAGYDAYALGLQEYSALVTQEAGRLDILTCTVLLRDRSPKSSLVPIVKFSGRQYVFSTETAITPFGDIRFRPAIEITE